MQKDVRNRILIKLLVTKLRLTEAMLTTDAYPKDPDPKNWRTIKGAHVHLSNGEIDGGAGGKFTGKTWNKSKPGEQGRSNGRVKELLGVEYKHLKGKEAIKKLLSERNGYVRNAYHNKQLGDIALVYGNEKLGLKHIIERRKKQGFNDEMIKSLLYNLDDVISSGKVSRSTKGRSTFEIYKDGNVAIISPTLNGANFKFMLTAYRTKKRK